MQTLLWFKLNHRLSGCLSWVPWKQIKAVVFKPSTVKPLSKLTVLFRTPKQSKSTHLPSPWHKTQGSTFLAQTFILNFSFKHVCLHHNCVTEQQDSQPFCTLCRSKSKHTIKLPTALLLSHPFHLLSPGLATYQQEGYDPILGPTHNSITTALNIRDGHEPSWTKLLYHPGSWTEPVQKPWDASQGPRGPKIIKPLWLTLLYLPTYFGTHWTSGVQVTDLQTRYHQESIFGDNVRWGFRCVQNGTWAS